MIRISRRRFQLSSETLRLLGAPALRGVAGGNVPVITIVTFADSCDCSVTTIVTTTHKCKGKITAE